MLTPGRYSTLTWSIGRERIGSITLAAQQAGVRLIYHTKNANGERVDVNELVPFTYTPTRFGGQRQWFCCPDATGDAGRSMVVATSGAGSATTCDTRHRAKTRPSAH
jgi:hypothetical protein